jgi:formylglycine-generating enzyme required for sulfatase activity
LLPKIIISDGGLYPLDVYSYGPNRKGIYNLLGNIAEWTISPAYNTSDVVKISLDTLHKTITYYTKQSRQGKIRYLKTNFLLGFNEKHQTHLPKRWLHVSKRWKLAPRNFSFATSGLLVLQTFRTA